MTPSEAIVHERRARAASSAAQALLEPALRAIRPPAPRAPHRRRRLAAAICVAFLLTLLAAPALAVGDSEKMPIPREIVLGSDYLHYHPDLRFRLRGMGALHEGRPELAMELFRKAARYADKASQAMVAELLWRGDGVPQDRAAAYAWMDLAAERGHKPWVAFRESYWSELSAEERERAIRVGQAIYAEFGDDVAQQRMEHQLRKRRMTFTGSRVGMVRPDLDVYVPAGGSMRRITTGLVYQERFWHADAYWEWQDQIWEELPEGIVTVRDIEAVDDDAVDADAESGEASGDGQEGDVDGGAGR